MESEADSDEVSCQALVTILFMKKNSTTQAIRLASHALSRQIEGIGKQSVRAMGNLIHRSKSSVSRLWRAQERRNLHLESALWETKQGEDWLRLLTTAVLYKFGIQHHVGADALSDFFKMIRINTHVGVSPGAMLNQLKRMEELLPTFQQQCEASAPLGTRKAVLAADETFFNQMMILVLMDLSSGYLVLESIADDRTFDTWFSAAEPRLKALGIEVNHAISDRAKALIKLAVTGFDCASGADLFHEQYGISKWLSSALGRRKAKAQVQCEEAENALKTKSSKVSAKDVDVLQAQRISANETLENAAKVQQEYREQLQAIAEEVHPFSPVTTACTTANSVSMGLEKRAQAIESLAVREGIADKHSAMKKFRAQIASLSSHVGVWWLWVEKLLLDLSGDTDTLNWLRERLLPVLYWHHQMHKTQNHAHRTDYRRAWQCAVSRFESDPFRLSLSTSELEHWVQWGEWMVRQFHRSSSAVEGRNGRLSQMYHNGRGLTKKRLAALTVVHNYGLKRADGTTAAQRLFGSPFPDVFEWLISQMGALPLPRKPRERIKRNPLILQGVPP